ncbi:MAG: CUB domain-containing protein, partial [Crocinitomicaceae bacterium]
MSGGTINTCSGTFYDSGGSGGNYANSENTTMTFCSDTPGEEIIFDFTSFTVETGWDELTVYDGSTTGAPQLAGSPFNSGNPPGTISSTNGCLTFVFTSDGSVAQAGWEATISCSVPSCVDGIQNQTETGIDCGGPCGPCNDLTINMGGTVNACSGTFSDSGGSAGNYAASENYTMTICSDNGGEISLDFSSFPFEVETSFDFLDIYDGTTTTGTPMYQSVVTGGTTNPGTITSTTGCLTIQFQSDGIVQYQGWTAVIECPTCSDGVQNGNETGVDCGGPDCVACPNCFDSVQNQDETGIDCGGVCPEACHCSNGVMDGDETDVDCGGSCYPCPVPCAIDATYEVLTGTMVAGGCCDYTLQMNDSWGDGWNGASVSVNVNGVDQGPFTLGSGTSGTATISICDGDAIDIDYTNSGSFPSEVSFQFIDPDGVVLYNSGSGPAVANNVYTGTGSCMTLALDCNGGDILLTADGQGAYTYVLNNDFDGGTAGDGWNTNINADFSNPCDPSIDGGTYMWMGNSAPHPRIIETTPLDLSCGGSICFFLDFATQGNASPCEGIDLADEGVYLEYSIDGGATWITMEYYGPNGVGDNVNGGGSDPQMTAWNQYCLDIPAGAETNNTMFHWAQTGSSGLNNDHWGLDNVTISSLVNCDPYYYDWAQVPGFPDDSAQTETLTTTTTYTVTYTNGTDACTTSVTVPVPPGTTADAGPDITMCQGAGPVIIGNDPVTTDDGAIYTWDNGAGSGTIDLVGGVNGQVSVNPATTTDYIVQVDFNGCTEYDTMTVTVDLPPTASDPAPINVECLADVPVPDVAVVTDEADDFTIPPTVTHLSDVSDNNTCPETITRTYRVTDACGNFVDVFQTITVDDITPPTGTAPANVAVQCIGDVPAVDVNAITNEADNCSVPTVTHISDVSDNNTCPEVITRTYRIEDDCNNFIDVTQTITVDDTQNPTGTAPANVAVQCIADVPAADPLLITNEADNCTVNPTVTHISDVSDNNTCPETITRTYRIEDDCNNFIDVT